MSTVTRAVRGANAAGHKVSSFEIDSTGKLRVSMVDGQPVMASSDRVRLG